MLTGTKNSKWVHNSLVAKDPVPRKSYLLASSCDDVSGCSRGRGSHSSCPAGRELSRQLWGRQEGRILVNVQNGRWIDGQGHHCLPVCPFALLLPCPLSSSVLSSFVRSCCVGRDTIFKGGDVSETCLIYSYETVILFQGQATYILPRMIIVLTMREYLKHTEAI